ncbi:unnamed protein product, partial [Discosporangium mesarthrocarpum]
SGAWDVDLLLAESLKSDVMEKMYMQSHTFSHLGRDDLGESDCNTEDQANTQMAIASGLYYNNSNYNWYSMTTPGITGLFNHICLKSAMDQLITCAPGDNTYPVLVSDVSVYHSIHTSVEEHGLEGFQIVPRFATDIYYNCRTPECLVQENEMIRRIVCECENVDPSVTDKGDCTETEEYGCPLTEGGFISHGSFEALMATEEERVTRQMLMGHRDKYMFHQLNMRLTDIPGEEEQKSLLQYWIERVAAKFTSMINVTAFPLKSKKFDDLCLDFKYHEDSDFALAVVTAT